MSGGAELHERLRLARGRASGAPNQKTVGAALGVRHTTISAWENHITKAWKNHITKAWKNLEALCRYYEDRGVNPGWIVTGNGPIAKASDEDTMSDLGGGFDDLDGGDEGDKAG